MPDVPEFAFARSFAAPRALVWAAHTDVGRLMRWWGPKGFTMKAATLDLRPGGLFHYGLETPGGQVMWGRFAWREVAAPERLVSVVSFSDEDGGVTRHPFAPSWPLEVLSTAVFTDEGGGTRLSLTSVPLGASVLEQRTFEAGFPSMTAGFAASFDQLDAYLKTAA